VVSNYLYLFNNLIKHKISENFKKNVVEKSSMIRFVTEGKQFVLQMKQKLNVISENCDASK